MANNTIPELVGDLSLQSLDLLRMEFNQTSCSDIDQVVVVNCRRPFIAGPSIAELVPLDDAEFLEPLYGSINCRE